MKWYGDFQSTRSAAFFINYLTDTERSIRSRIFSTIRRAQDVGHGRYLSPLVGARGEIVRSRSRSSKVHTSR